MKGYHDSKTPETIRDLWRTPKQVFEYYDKRFGFTLDMAASSDNALCSSYIDVHLDALNYDTFSAYIGNDGRMKNLAKNRAFVWVNPPYSDCAEWVKTVCTYHMMFNCGFVMLLPADTSVKWFKMAYKNCTECHFISGRLAFINEETGKPVSGNNKGSVVFVFDPHSPIKQAVSLIDRDEMMGIND